MTDRSTSGDVVPENAVAAWRDAIGLDAVICAAGPLANAGSATFATTSRVAAILRPASHTEVEQCVRIANRFRVAMYPVSSGKNWGYGSRAPVRDSVLLDLSRLNRIIDFSEELAYVTIEPGVTQRHLYEFLRGRNSQLWMDATGASPDCSIIGNTVERGFGHTPMGEHCSHACAFQVVLPTGDTIETGFGRFPNAKATPLSRWGVGPAFDGLFSQSNLGIVTRMTVWLMPRPEHFEAFVFQANKPVGPIVDALRPLRMSGTLRSVIHLGNDYKVLSGTGQYPWQATDGKTPLSLETMARLRSELRIAQWSGTGALYGTKAQVREAKRLLRLALAGRIDRLQFVDDNRLRLLRRVERPYRLITRRNDVQRALKMLPSLLDVLQGAPTDGFLSSAYWRKRTPIPEKEKMDPDADKCGLLWCSPVAPTTGEDVTHVTSLGTAVALKHGFEPMISTSLINERMTISTIALTYDREQQGEDSRAQACYQALSEELFKRGYPPYRLNVNSMDLASLPGAYSDMLRAVKDALDPNRILAPGRYE
jgi:4-cresol dehydrogenase (hydroxylating) flavoprotein subunit